MELVGHHVGEKRSQKVVATVEVIFTQSSRPIENCHHLAAGQVDHNLQDSFRPPQLLRIAPLPVRISDPVVDLDKAARWGLQDDFSLAFEGQVFPVVLPEMGEACIFCRPFCDQGIKCSAEPGLLEEIGKLIGQLDPGPFCLVDFAAIALGKTDVRLGKDRGQRWRNFKSSRGLEAGIGRFSHDLRRTQMVRRHKSQGNHSNCQSACPAQHQTPMLVQKLDPDAAHSSPGLIRDFAIM
ncbi:MAG TPA: hypothetical protein PLL44_12190 [Novosphingobium sp.]|jgi:hypothetical protein|nr:hypothetical protein [Novosphingobium sp.]